MTEAVVALKLRLWAEVRLAERDNRNVQAEGKRTER